MSAQLCFSSAMESKNGSKARKNMLNSLLKLGKNNVPKASRKKRVSLEKNAGEEIKLSLMKKEPITIY